MCSLSLLSAGSNARGQLATGNVDDAHTFSQTIFAGEPPGQLPGNAVAVETIACGANHTLLLLRRSVGQTELWGCGDGSRGQLGPTYREETKATSEDAMAVFRPIDLRLSDIGKIHYTVRLVAAGWETSYVVLSRPESDDVLLSMGANDFGNLGVVGSESQIHVVPLRDYVPSKESTHLQILSISAGPHHTIVRVRLSSPGGTCTTHVLGWGTSRHGQLGPILSATGNSVSSVSNPHIVPVPSPEDISDISLGNQHSIFLRPSGTLSALGSNRKSQLSGLDALQGEVVEQVGCTWNGTYALLRSGRILAAGSNTHSQLGRGKRASEVERHGDFGPVQLPFNLEPKQITRVACGSEHVLCIIRRADAADGEVWGWGWNEHGNLGIGGTEDTGTPVRVWPPADSSQASSTADGAGDAVGVWAGCGTSWILVKR